PLSVPNGYQPCTGGRALCRCGPPPRFATSHASVRVTLPKTARQTRWCSPPPCGEGLGVGSLFVDAARPTTTPPPPQPSPSRLRACPLPAILKMTEPRQAGVRLGEGAHRVCGPLIRSDPKLHQRWALDLFSATAARMRVFSAAASILSPSWKSMARLWFPSRLALKRRAGSCSAAPLAKVIFTTFL